MTDVTSRDLVTSMRSLAAQITLRRLRGEEIPQAWIQDAFSKIEEAMTPGHIDQPHVLQAALVLMDAAVQAGAQPPNPLWLALVRAVIATDDPQLSAMVMRTMHHMGEIPLSDLDPRDHFVIQELAERARASPTSRRPAPVRG